MTAIFSASSSSCFKNWGKKLHHLVKLWLSGGIGTQPFGMMSFYFSDTAVLLFDFWSVHTPTGMALSVLVILLLSMLYEAVKMGKAVLLRRALLALPRSLSRESLAEPEEGGTGPAQGRWFRYHIGQTLFHVVQVVLGYMVMLAVMSYNVWIFLGAIAGSTLGYFVVYPLLGRG
ncbi:probable low affinity copper uptake protein 2 [Gymnogyps californianus]|uniref:probable low affinity copper uptake protein 2 n=1 Tax=Gymnogyps californianus TaxID=33616 RepID=UPI0021CAB767|nr:probable low affinity copper uptake protein 2 [Gymnogyps californianus]